MNNKRGRPITKIILKDHEKIELEKRVKSYTTF